MGSPFRSYCMFTDAGGVLWGVEARLVGEGADTIAVGFTFTSQLGEQRTLAGACPDCLSWEQLSCEDWCRLLGASRVVRAAGPRNARRRYTAATTRS
jgi:hypothetical protein